MVSKLDDTKFLENLTPPYDQAKKDRLKEIFSTLLNQPEKNLTPLVNTLKYCHLSLPKETTLVVGYLTFKNTPLKVRRYVSEENKFSFVFHDLKETPIVSIKLEKREGYLCCCDFYVDHGLDPYLPDGKRPLTQLAIRILKEIFARETSYSKLHIFVSRDHTGPVLYATGFRILHHAQALKERHEYAIKEGREVAEWYDPPNMYDAELLKPIPPEPNLLLGTESLL